MTAEEILAFCVEMQNKARRETGKSKRITYTQAERERALVVLHDIEGRGGNAHTAALMMGMRTSTLVGWLVKATAPGSNWRLLMAQKASGDLLEMRLLDESLIGG